MIRQPCCSAAKSHSPKWMSEWLIPLFCQDVNNMTRDMCLWCGSMKCHAYTLWNDTQGDSAKWSAEAVLSSLRSCSNPPLTHLLLLLDNNPWAFEMSFTPLSWVSTPNSVSGWGRKEKEITTADQYSSTQDSNRSTNQASVPPSRAVHHINDVFPLGCRIFQQCNGAVSTQRSR